MRALLLKFDSHSGDVVIGNMIPILAAIIVELNEELERTNRKMYFLTWGIFFFSAVLTILTLILAVPIIWPIIHAVICGSN